MVRHVVLVETGSAAGAMLRLPLWLPGYRTQVIPEEVPVATWAAGCRAELLLVGSPELCRSVKLQPNLASLPVILYGPPAFAGLRVEPEAFLTGPVTANAVAAAVERALAVKAARLREGILAELNVWLPSDRDDLEELNSLLLVWLAGCGLTPFQVQQTSIAAREVVANAIEWGHRYERSRLVRVEAKLDDEKVTVLVRDTGPGFDRDNMPHAARPGDPLSHLRVRADRRLRDGGFGILMASGLVDHLCYSDSGNEGLLIKYLPARPYVDPTPRGGLTPSLTH